MDLIKLLKNKNHSNILLYNLNDSKLFVRALKNTYTINQNINITQNDISYIKNNIYFEFNIDNIKYIHKSDFINIINDIIDGNYNKYIIFQVGGNIPIQNILKIIIEKNTHLKFVIVTNNFSNIIEPLRSRFLSIRIPNKKVKDIKANLYKRHVFDYIFDLYYKSNTNIIKNIKYISFLLKCINDTFNIFLIDLFEYVDNRVEITQNIKYKFLYFITDIEYKYNKGYLKIIYYEYILLKLYSIIKT